MAATVYPSTPWEFLRWTPTEDVWQRVVLKGAADNGCNRVAISFSGSEGRIAHAAIAGAAVDTTAGTEPTGDQFGEIPADEWYFFDFDRDDPPELYLSTSAANTEIQVHVTAQVHPAERLLGPTPDGARWKRR